MDAIKFIYKPCPTCEHGVLSSFCLKCIKPICLNESCSIIHSTHGIVTRDYICKFIVLQQIIKSQNQVYTSLQNVKAQINTTIDKLSNDIESKIKINNKEICCFIDKFNNAKIDKDIYNALISSTWIESNQQIFSVLNKVYELEKARLAAFTSDSTQIIQSTTFPILAKSPTPLKIIRKPKSCEDPEGILLHKYIPKTNIIVFSRPKSQITSVICIEGKLPLFCDTIMLSNTIYCAGGKESNKYTSKASQLKILQDKAHIIDISPMFSSKAIHTLCKYRLTHFLSIGGFNAEPLTDAEVYSIAKKQWFRLPALTDARYACATCIYNDEWVYAIAGMSKDGCISSIERLSIKAQVSWEYIPIEDNDKQLVRNDAYAVQTYDDTILVFGGIWNGNLQESKEIVIKGRIHRIREKQGVKLDAFYCSSGVEKVGKMVYAYSKDGKCFAYSIEDDEWNFMRIELSEGKSQ